MMLRKTLRYVAVLACAVLFLASRPVSADDKKDDKGKPALSGVWVLKGGEPKIEFSDKDVLKVSPHGNDELILVLCKYTIEKEGRVKAEITGFEGKEEVKEKVKEKLPVGFAFSFTWKVKGDTATLDDVKGENVEILKSHLEGKYEQKK